MIIRSTVACLILTACCFVVCQLIGVHHVFADTATPTRTPTPTKTPPYHGVGGMSLGTATPGATPGEVFCLGDSTDPSRLWGARSFAEFRKPPLNGLTAPGSKVNIAEWVATSVGCNDSPMAWVEVGYSVECKANSGSSPPCSSQNPLRVFAYMGQKRTNGAYHRVDPEVEITATDGDYFDLVLFWSLDNLAA